MRVAYITAKIPFGSQETFILTEILELQKSGMDIVILPRDKGKHVLHKNAESLLPYTLNIPWFDHKIALNALRLIIVKPLIFIKLIYKTVFKARNLKIGLKNLVILPKSLYVSNILRKKSISHIHAHWASTTATMAYIISEVTGIPWSFTAHRWDISENNILKEKCKTASFVRAISKDGQKEINDIVNNISISTKTLVIHMGINIPNNNAYNNPASRTFTILCPANLVTIKGHKYLFEACYILSKKDFNIKCLIAGDGPLEEELKKLTIKLNIQEYIEFLGRLPHDMILELYSKSLIDAVVLPSIVTDDGEKEGIPVALMEAMSYGVPVVSTNTGGIVELIDGECGVLIEQKDSTAIARAIEKLIIDKAYYESLCKKGREKVLKDFNISETSSRLSGLFMEFASR